MTTALYTSLAAFLLCLIFTPLVRMLAAHLNWFDEPDQHRKFHLHRVPRIGGVSVMLGYTGSAALIFLAAPYLGFQLHPAFLFAWLSIPVAFFAFITGLLDDVIGLNAKQKLAGQVVAAAFACGAGLQLHSFAGKPLHPYIGVPVTMLWLLICMNALNLVDGVDGLAGGVGMIGALAAAVGALLCGDTGLVLLALPLAAALAAFLIFNWTPASIFLGDSGSLTVGFLLGILGIRWANDSTRLLGTFAPIIAFIVPLLDMSLAIVRRFLASKPIFGADQGHVHHRLLRVGYSSRNTVRLMWAVAALGGIAAGILTFAQVQVATAACAVLAVTLALFIVKLRYTEFHALANSIRHWNFRSDMKMRIALLDYAAKLRQAETPDECWGVLVAAGDEFGFACSAMKLGERFFWEQGRNHLDSDAWNVTVPLSGLGYLTLVRTGSCDGVLNGIPVQLTDVLKQTLEAKAEALRASTLVVSTRKPAPFRVPTTRRPATEPPFEPPFENSAAG